MIRQLTRKKRQLFFLVAVLILLWNQSSILLSLKNHDSKLWILQSLFGLDSLKLIPTDFLEPPACLWPPLDPWHPELKSWIKTPPKTTCPKIQPDLATLHKNGTVMTIRSDGVQESFTCYYRSVNGSFWPKNHEMDMGDYIEIKKRQIKVTLDQFEVACFNDSVLPTNRFIGKKFNGTPIYRQAFMQISPKPERKFEKSSPEKLSIDILVLDSVSYPQFKRTMPKTLDFMRDTMEFLIFEKPAKVGDNTLVNIIPLLTGKKLVEPNHVKLDNFSSEFPSRKLIADEDFPFIWNKYKEKNCVTMLNVDPVLKGFGFLYYQPSFVRGFKSAPTDYYFRPFHNYYILNGYDKSKKQKRFCRGNAIEHELTFNLSKQWFETYKDTCHFSITLALHSYTHDYPADVNRLDEPVLELLQTGHKNNHYQNTILLIIGDHGHRLSPIKYLFQGQLEERMAFYSIYFPSWFRAKHPKVWKNLQANREKLVTHYDFHETFKDIQSGNFVARSDVEYRRGVSLFGKIAENRTCNDTHTQIQFCPCLVPNNVTKITNSTYENVRRVLDDWLTESRKCLDCNNENRTRIFTLRAFTSNKFVRSDVRHFDKDALERLKKPLKEVSDFLWFVAETKIGSDLLVFRGMVQHTKPSAKLKESFKLNSEPEFLAQIK